MHTCLNHMDMVHTEVAHQGVMTVDFAKLREGQSRNELEGSNHPNGDLERSLKSMKCDANIIRMMCTLINIVSNGKGEGAFTSDARCNFASTRKACNFLPSQSRLETNHYSK